MSFVKYNSKRKTNFFAFLIINLILSIGFMKFSFGSTLNSRYNTYSISITWNGMESSFLERNIAVPLEKMLFPMKGLLDLNTIVSNDKVCIYLIFDIKEKNKTIYSGIRDCLDKLYEDLPLSVQQPVVSQSSFNDHPVFYMCLLGEKDLHYLNRYAENVLKPEFERIKDVSQVIVSGGMAEQIMIKIDGAKSAYYGFDPQKISSVVQDANTNFPSSMLSSDKNIDYVNYVSKLCDFKEIENLEIETNEEIVPLSKIIDVKKGYKDRKEIVRINGLETIALAVMGTSSGNTIQISKECRRVLQKLDLQEDHYKILLDEGRVHKDLVVKVIIALIQSIVLVLLLVPLFYSSKKIAFLIGGFLIVDVTWSLLILSILRYVIDQNIIAGITISLGLAADPFLVIAELKENCDEEIQFYKKFHSLVPSLFLSLITTLIVLVPIYFSNSIVPGIGAVSVAIGISLVVSNILAMVFYPPLVFLSNVNTDKNRILKAINFIGMKNNRQALILFFLSTVCSVIVIILMNKNLNVPEETNVIYGTVEYEKDIRCDVIDENLKSFCCEISEIPSVEYCRVESSKGRAELAVKISKVKKRKQIMEAIRNISRQPDGFLYFEDAIKNGRTGTRITVNICGDESNICRKLAIKTSYALTGMKSVVSSVLNFKQNGKYIQIKPDREILTKLRFTPREFSQALFWNNGNPVIDKWNENGMEKDVSIENFNDGFRTLDFIANIDVPISGSTLKTGGISEISEKESCGRITRKNCRPSTSFTVEIDDNSLSSSIKIVKDYLKMIPLPEGYVFVLDMESEALSENYFLLAKVIIICTLLLYFLLCVMTENFRNSALMISIIPMSIIIPLLMKIFSGTPLVMGDLLGIALSAGITVNTTIAIMSQKNVSLMSCYRNKIKSIFVTSLTTMAGSIPVLFAGQKGCGYDLSFFMLFSTAGSLFAIIKIFPALVAGNKTNVHEVFLQ